MRTCVHRAWASVLLFVTKGNTRASECGTLTNASFTSFFIPSTVESLGNSAFYGCSNFVYDVATDIENVQGDNVQSTKFIENGMLIIEKNGVRYNAQGQIVK